MFTVFEGSAGFLTLTSKSYPGNTRHQSDETRKQQQKKFDYVETAKFDIYNEFDSWNWRYFTQFFFSVNEKLRFCSLYTESAAMA